MATRSPICVVVGHVDHGKSSVLDYIRNTNIVAHEAGKITQAIGASIIPINLIQEKCEHLIKAMNMKFTIPGLLFIDTPGHAAFTGLRKRGGNLADIAVLVIDINEGFKPQTIESIKILKESKTPFLVAANKIDLVNEYKTTKQTGIKSVLGNIAKLSEQHPSFSTKFETKMYELVQALYEQGFPAERFDRVSDFTKEVAIVPTSAACGDGMAELLVVLSALAQKFLEQQLKTNVDGPARGTVLEVKEQQGLGTVIDTIIYDGTIKVNDTIVIGHPDEPIVTKVRALLTPATTQDMRDAKCKYQTIKSASAATGVRISAPDIEKAMSGMPIAVAVDLEETKAQVQEEVADFDLDTDDEGIIIKADTLGGLEALRLLLKEADIPVRVASVGQITKKDLLEAQSNEQTNPIYACIMGFNIKKPEGSDVKIFTAPVIYQLLDDYAAWKKIQDEKIHQAKKATLPALGKARFMQGCCFRQSNPAIIGVQILLGRFTLNMQLIKADKSSCGSVKSLQENKTSLQEATKDMEIACGIDGVTINKQIIEGDIFYSRISEEEFRLCKDHKDLLTPQEKEILKEIAEIYRKEQPLWGA